ncbi:hypothetical protein HNQ85_003489 [Anoxybacillus calidus]|uniref:Uncharacterized protein n=1 Tax=[Anoxybacillus] calidus TaxID=575178 RepID=A0A7V9Z347_9BACL|nr:hypothetical protein [Anoxybacillus calidus]MBA2873151.1 hypothetical protein [Anoxybacillus calidus]
MSADDLEKLIRHIYVLQKGRCYYTGIEMEPPDVKERNKNYSISVDRLDNERGYELDNVVLCCRVVNIMKNNLPYKEFTDLCQRIAEEQKVIEKLLAIGG